MAETKVAKRYAKSLLDLAIENNIVDEISKDMQSVLNTIRANRELSVFFKSPIINTDKKDAVLRSVFEGRINKMILTFFSIITRKKREYYIEDITASFIELYKEYRHIQTAVLITAVKADDSVKKDMLALIAKTTSNTIELKEQIDPSIIGGFILRWGDRQVDTSVARKLHELRQDFRDNLYLKDY
jgi:F-type H+-transporting ATPase subunit delta